MDKDYWGLSESLNSAKSTQIALNLSSREFIPRMRYKLS